MLNLLFLSSARLIVHLSVSKHLSFILLLLLPGLAESWRQPLQRRDEIYRLRFGCRALLEAERAQERRAYGAFNVRSYTQ